MSLATPEKIRTLQRKLYRKAKAAPAFRFYLLYDKICRDDILEHAYALARTNGGAPGVDGTSFAAIEAAGLAEWLAGIRKDLIAKTYRPVPVRRVMIPKPGGGERPLGIPTIRDRVVQTAPNWCWSRSSRRISILRPMAIGRAGAGPTRSRRCMPCCAEASPMWWTPIWRSISTRSRIAS
jgi:retron-type reverse transcriptase